MHYGPATALLNTTGSRIHSKASVIATLASYSSSIQLHSSSFNEYFISLDKQTYHVRTITRTWYRSLETEAVFWQLNQPKERSNPHPVRGHLMYLRLDGTIGQSLRRIVGTEWEPIQRVRVKYSDPYSVIELVIHSVTGGSGVWPVTIYKLSTLGQDATSEMWDDWIAHHLFWS